MAKFEVVNKYLDTEKYPQCPVVLPVRATKNAAGYDFCASETVLIPSYSHNVEQLKGYMADKTMYSLPQVEGITKFTGIKPTLVPTGVKCKLDSNQYLEITARSSMPLKYWLVLANSEGIIDSDYYGNESNDGEICFQLINLAPSDIIIQQGDKIGQGIIKTYITVEDEEEVTTERTGGFGSTDDKN